MNYWNKGNKERKMSEPIVYAVQHMDDSIRALSRSGGAFTAISDRILMDGGVVYGCVLDESFGAKHIRATTKEERNLMRGSKYIQSNMGNSYRQIKADLEAEKKVLFSGTSCQVAGLQAYLKTEYSNLLCVGIVCHGVPSKRIWKDYVSWQEKRIGSKVVAVNFRNKNAYGWRAHFETLEFQNGKKCDSEIFRNIFLNNNVLRPSCYECRYKSLYRPEDITIADFWGIEKAAPEFDDNKGVSLVLINTERGMALFNQIGKDIRYVKTKIEVSLQPALMEPLKRPNERECFWKEYQNFGVEYILKKYGGYSLAKELIRKYKRFVKRILVRWKYH